MEIAHYLSCHCSIVGNPLICATGSEQECYGTTLMPMSMTLNSSQSTDFKIFPAFEFIFLNHHDALGPNSVFVKNLPLNQVYFCITFSFIGLI